MKRWVISLGIAMISWGLSFAETTPVYSTAPTGSAIYDNLISSFPTILVSVKITSPGIQTSQLELFNADVSTQNAPRLTPTISGATVGEYHFSDSYFVDIATAGVRYNKIGIFECEIQVVPAYDIPDGRYFR